MKRITLVLVIVLWLSMVFLSESAGSGNVEEKAKPPDCDICALASKWDKQGETISQEIRQIKREIVLLKQSLEKPSLKDIFAGIGYILGLCGVGFYFSGRRSSETSTRGDRNAHS